MLIVEKLFHDSKIFKFDDFFIKKLKTTSTDDSIIFSNYFYNSLCKMKKIIKIGNKNLFHRAKYKKFPETNKFFYNSENEKEKKNYEI